MKIERADTWRGSVVLLVSVAVGFSLLNVCFPPVKLFDTD